jgi:hypothetical protein
MPFSLNFALINVLCEVQYFTYFDSIGSTINLSKATTGPFTTCNLTESMRYLVALDAAENPTNCAANG